MLTGVTQLQTHVAIDASRMYIEGASYGGYLSSWIATHPSPFRAAVAGVPVEDLTLQTALSQSPGLIERFFGERPLADNSARLRDQSTVTYAGSLRIPLLILANLNDTQAPYPQAILFYKKALESGKPVDLVGYPGLAHEFGGPLNVADWYHRIAGWFHKYGGPAF